MKNEKTTEEKTTTKEERKSKENRASLDGYYPGLNGLNYVIGYLEQALSVLSEPLLIGCSALAVVDFITGGGLLALPFLMYLWASALAVAVTACFIVTWRKSFRAFSQNRYAVGFFLALLGTMLGLVDWTAIATQSLQQGLHMSFGEALTSLGFDPFIITNIRAGVAISMAVVVAISNHTAVTTAEAPKRRLAALDSLLNKIAPVVTAAPASTPGTEKPQAPVSTPGTEKPQAPVSTPVPQKPESVVVTLPVSSMPTKAPENVIAAPALQAERNTDALPVMASGVVDSLLNETLPKLKVTTEMVAPHSNGHSEPFVPPYRRNK